MRRLLSVLHPPADPVVAVRDTEGAVESAVQILGSAGYHSGMLTVVGRQGSLHRPLGVAGPQRYPAWRRSGLFWGLSLAGLVTLASMAVPAAALAPTSLGLIAAMALALQAWIVATAVAPEQVAGARWRSSATGCLGHEDELAADKLLLIVDGTRSEIALARALLNAN